MSLQRAYYGLLACVVIAFLVGMAWWIFITPYAGTGVLCGY